MFQDGWQASKQKNNNSAGDWIFKRIFENHPELKNVFGMENVPKTKMAENPQFRIHAERLSDVLQMAVEGIDALGRSAISEI